MFMHIMVECNNRIVLTRQITGVIMDYIGKTNNVVVHRKKYDIDEIQPL